MHKTTREIMLGILIHIGLFVFACGTVITAHAENNRSLSVRFPAFSLSPGERISGIKFKTSQGRIHVGCTPNRWTCDTTEASLHCYMLHQTYATALSGMLPEIIITHLSDEGSRPSMEASVELVDGNGKESTKEIREYELIVK